MKRGYVKIGLLAFAFGCLVMSAKVDARAEEPDYSKVSYATPAKEESDWVTEGIYSYCLIRNKKAVKLRISDTNDVVKEEKGVIPTKIKGLPVKEVDHVSVKSWKTLVIPAGIEVIGETTFYNENLQSVQIGKDVQYIGEAAFSSNKNLQTVTGGEGVRFVGNQAFSYCRSLSQMPQFMRKNKKCIYGSEIFRGDRSLRNITVSKNMRIPMRLFRDVKDCVMFV